MYSLSGETFVQAKDSELIVHQSNRMSEKFNIGTAIEWLKVSPDGKIILIYGARGTRIWRWREDSGVEPFLESSGRRDIIGSGFITAADRVITITSREGVLQGITSTDSEVFSCNLKSPHAFFPRNFIQLANGRIALAGSFFSDYCDVVVTVKFDDLLQNVEAVQKGIHEKAPVWDRAIDITVGPCEPDSAVVLRKPEEAELAEDEDEDEDDFGDIRTLTGVYIRNLNDGMLLGKYPYKGNAGSGAGIAASSTWIAIQTLGGMDMINRGSGMVYQVPDAILDVWGLQAGFVKDGALVRRASLEKVIKAEK